MANAIFSPPQNPSFSYRERRVYNAEVVTTAKGYGKVLPLTVNPVMHVELNWNVTTKENLEYIVSFFDSLLGPSTPFDWAPLNLQASPAEGPSLDSVSGGSLLADTYYASFSWFNSSEGQETRPSRESFLSILDDNLLTVTAPPFPSGVLAFRVYLGTVSGDLKLQAASTSRTWTLPLSGIDATGDAPKSVNDLNPKLTWRLNGDVSSEKIAAQRYRVGVSLIEVFA